MFRIFGPRYLSTLKPHLILFTDPNWNSVCEQRLYWIFLLQRFHILSEQQGFLLFYTAVLLIFLDFLLELLQNYLFLEVIHMMLHCNCNRSYIHVFVSDLNDYQMFDHSTRIHKGQYANWDSIKDFIKLSNAQESWICKFLLVHLGFCLHFCTVLKYNNWILNCHHCWLHYVFDQYFLIFCKKPIFFHKISYLCPNISKWHLSWFSLM